jgi:Uma2 family endonuclease
VSTALFKDLLHDRTGIVPLSVEQYHRMIETGILEEDPSIELLDGFLVRKDRSKRGADPMTIGIEHAWVVNNLIRILSNLNQSNCHLRIGAPVTIGRESELEPDASIATGSGDSFRKSHPTPQDILCIIEVSDSSLNRDRTTKLRIYADAGIPQYLIVNLVDRCVEEYSSPITGSGRFANTRIAQPAQTVTLHLGDTHQLELSVTDLLP